MTDPHDERPDALGTLEDGKPSLGARLIAELRARPVAWITFAAILVIAPIILKMIFPDATPGVLVAGTIAFTAYAAACTVPGRFL